jgi:hypothetical protein
MARLPGLLTRDVRINGMSYMINRAVILLVLICAIALCPRSLLAEVDLKDKLLGQINSLLPDYIRAVGSTQIGDTATGRLDIAIIFDHPGLYEITVSGNTRPDNGKSVDRDIAIDYSVHIGPKGTTRIHHRLSFCADDTVPVANVGDTVIMPIPIEYFESLVKPHRRLRIYNHTVSVVHSPYASPEETPGTDGNDYPQSMATIINKILEIEVIDSRERIFADRPGIRSEHHIQVHLNCVDTGAFHLLAYKADSGTRSRDPIQVYIHDSESPIATHVNRPGIRLNNRSLYRDCFYDRGPVAARLGDRILTEIATYTTLFQQRQDPQYVYPSYVIDAKLISIDE